MKPLQYKQRLLDLERDLVARTAREMKLGREQTDEGVAVGTLLPKASDAARGA